VSVCAILACSIWYVISNPQSFLFFLITTIAALCFVVIVTSSTKYRRHIIRKAVDYNRARERSPLFYRLRNVSMAITLVGALVFPIMVKLVPSIYFSVFVVTFVVVELVAGVLFTVALLKTSRRLGIIYLMVLIFGAVIGLIAGYTHHLEMI
jgi:hypothetical protein